MAYIAGIVDGEGCITITKRKPKKAGWNCSYQNYPDDAIDEWAEYYAKFLKEATNAK